MSLYDVPIALGVFVAAVGSVVAAGVPSTEGQGSVEQYCEFESYSLRHSV